MSPEEHISVAEAKRRFADVLGEVRYGRRRFIVERNGTPMAALVPLDEMKLEPEPRGGFLALIGEFADAPEYADALDEAVDSRRQQGSRPAPQLRP
jgi:prevent-host-death family protein